MTDKRKNTILPYLYRDASNFKNFGSVVFRGEFSKGDIDKIRGNLFECEFFIPSDVGLSPLYFDKITDEDHPWHELDLDGILLTDREPSDPRTIGEFADEFSQAEWDEFRQTLLIEKMKEETDCPDAVKAIDEGEEDYESPFDL